MPRGVSSKRHYVNRHLSAIRKRVFVCIDVGTWERCLQWLTNKTVVFDLPIVGMIPAENDAKEAR